MIKFIVLFVGWCGVMQVALVTEQMDKLKVLSEIRYVGYECDKVDEIQAISFDEIVTVTCDRVFKFTLKYKRGGVTVEIKS